MERAQMFIDKEEVVYIYIFQPSKKMKFCVDGTREYYSKGNKSIRERQLSYDFTHMWDIRNRAKDHRRRE